MASWQKQGSNGRMFNKFLKIVQEEVGDVTFIFDSKGANNDKNVTSPPPSKKFARRGKSAAGDDDGSVIKVLAHKKVLAASSPVFEAMFNDAFKAINVVKIDDVSLGAFREFLQIFQNDEVNLTVENLEEVMKLVVKYHVEDGWPTVDAFFMKSLAVDDALWGLHLAVKYRRFEAMAHCRNLIAQNCAAVCEMIEFDKSGKLKLRSNPNKRPLTDADLADIYTHVHASIKKYASKSVPVATLFLECGTKRIEQFEDISFSSNRALLVTHIKYPALIYAKESFDIKICVAGKESIYTMTDDGTIKLVDPVIIQANQMYTIQTKIVTKLTSPISFYGRKSRNTIIQMASNLQFTFDKEYSNLFVAGMNFLLLD